MTLTHSPGVEIRKKNRAGCFNASKASDASGRRVAPGASNLQLGVLTYSIVLKGLFRGPFSLIFNVTYRSIIKKNIKDKEAPTDESEPTVVAPTDESESTVAPTDESG